MLFRFLILCLILPFSLSNSVSASEAQEPGQVVADKIALFTAKAVYNLDEDQLSAVIENFLAENPKIKALVITESIDQEVLLTYFKQNDKAVYHQPIPKELLGLKHYSAESVFEGEIISVVDIYYAGSSSVLLNEKEKKWIADHSIISVGIEEWFPFVRAEADGTPGGIAGDFLNLILKKTDLKIKVIKGEWSTLLKDFENGKIDLLPATYYTDKRATYGLYSNPYFTAKEFLYIKEGNTAIRSFNDLKGKKLAIVEGYGTIPKIRKKFPNIEIIETKNQLESITAVFNEEIDALYESQIVIDDLLRKQLMTGLKSIGQTAFKASPLYYFSRIDEPILQSILTKALDSITEEERRVVINKWVVPQASVETARALASPPVLEKTSNLLIPMFIVLSTGLLLIFGIIVFFFGKSKKGKERDFSAYFGAPAFTATILAGLSVLVAIVTIMNWLAISDSKKSSIEATSYELQIVLRSSIERLNTWITHRQSFLKQMGRDPALVKITKKLLRIDRQRDVLIHSQALAEARVFFAFQKQFGPAGFFIISPDNISIGSRRNTNIGTPNFITQIRPDLIEKVFKGEALFIPPIRSDVNIGSEAEEITGKKPLTMFFASPITDEDGTVLAVLTERIVPSGSLSKILQLGRFGKSGETYAFNSEAKMVSESRFHKSFGKLGLTSSQSEGGGEVELRNPGRDLTQVGQANYRPGGNPNKQPLTYMARKALKLMKDGKKQDSSDQEHQIKLHPVNTDGYADYRGVPVVGAWTWLHNLELGLAAEIDLEEAMENHTAFQFNLIAISAISTILAISATLFTLLLGQRSHRSLTRARDELEDRVIERTQDLQDSEKRTRSIIENAVDGIIVINDKGIVQSFSPAAERIFGFTPQEVIGNNIKMLTPEPTRSEHDGYLKRFIETREARIVGQNREVIGLRKDGSTFPMDLSVGEAMLGNERIFTGTIRDITDRKEADQRLADKEKQLRAALDNMSSGMLMFDKDGKVNLLNDKYLELFDFPKDLLTVGGDAETSVRYQANRGDFGEGDVDELVDQVMGILSGGKVITYERELFTGHIVEINLAPTPDGGTVAVYNEITERKLAENKLSDAFNVISDSIGYAARIQRSVLPDGALFSSLLADHFVLWQPRDVVGGDIYWSRLWGDGFLIILGDCTGHGVPGAFMTLIATGALDKALSDVPSSQVGLLMQRLHQLVQITLGQHGEGAESDDGMELGICYLRADMKTMIFAGSRFDLYSVENETVNIIKGTKSGIGYRGIPHQQEYEEHHVTNLERKVFYMTSDGLIDQVGGERNRMFGKKRFRELLLSIQDQPMNIQRDYIHQTLIDYQGEQRRRDDVAVIGFKL